MGKKLELAGQRFGRLVVLEEIKERINNRIIWLCKCDCGKLITTAGRYLTRGETISCGCYHTEMRSKLKTKIENPGNRYGRLVVVSVAGKDKYTCILYSCICDCGKVVVVSGRDLRGGDVRSCGCITAELNKTRNLKHGQSGTRLYDTWHNMLARCNNPDWVKYAYYGGRGLTVCAEWYDFLCFAEWAEHSGYKEDLEIDRIDNNLGYNPENCRWVTREENIYNRRNTVKLSYKGEEKLIKEWAEITGIPESVLRSRRSSGWSDEDILTMPRFKKRKYKERNNASK